METNNIQTLISYNRFCKEEREIEMSIQNTPDGKEYQCLRQELTDLKSEKEKLSIKNSEIETALEVYNTEFNALLEEYNTEKEDADRMEPDEQIEASEYKECRHELEKIKAAVKSLKKKIYDNIQEYEKNQKRLEVIQVEGKSKMQRYEEVKVRYKAAKNAQKPRLDKICEKKSVSETILRKNSILWNKYQTLAAEKVDPLATVNDGKCSGCGMSLPKTIGTRIATNELVTCENCGRILVNSK